MTEPLWVVCRGHEPGCPCFACCMVNATMTREAVASVALDRDPRMRTMSLDDGEDQP